MRLLSSNSIVVASALVVFGVVGGCSMESSSSHGFGKSGSGSGTPSDSNEYGSGGGQTHEQPGGGGGGGGGGGNDAGAGSDSGGGGGNDSGSQTDSGGQNDPFDQFQHHNLDVINQYRATQNIAPLVLDVKLSTFALAGSQELSQNHQPHQHFIDASNNGTLWSSGFNTSAGENQGDPNGWTVLSSDPVKNEMQQIDQIQQMMFNEGPGSGEAHGHYMNMMNSAFKRVGVGLLEVSGSLYLTNDFSD